jgi:hypothetical protein
MPAPFDVHPYDLSEPSMPLTPNTASPSYTEKDAEALLGFFPPPAEKLQPLPLPVCLLQTVSGYDSPFPHAYNPKLVQSGV